MANISERRGSELKNFAQVEPPSPSNLDRQKTGPWILAATILGSGMVFIDTSAVNVALPRLQTDLNASATNVQFVFYAFNSSLNSYLGALHVAPAVRQVLDAQRNKLAGANVPPVVHGRLREAMGRAIAESFVAGYRLAMLIAAGLALLSGLCSFLLVEGKRN